MPRAVYKIKDGKLVEITANSRKSAQPRNVPYIIQDDIGQDLRHPVTGEVTNSKTHWNRINKVHGLEVVGNDLLSEKPRQIKDAITEEKVVDATLRAEATLSDPTKYREWENRQIERFEYMQRHMKNGN